MLTTPAKKREEDIAKCTVGCTLSMLGHNTSKKREEDIAKCTVCTLAC
jgi:hypothetical protein